MLNNGLRISLTVQFKHVAIYTRTCETQQQNRPIEDEGEASTRAGDHHVTEIMLYVDNYSIYGGCAFLYIHRELGLPGKLDHPNSLETSLRRRATCDLNTNL